MQIIFITGATGSGKSKLLVNAQQYSRIALFDCLSDGGASWAAPDVQDCDAVAVDHVHFRGDSRIIQDAVDWCSANCKPLLLAEVSRSDLHSLAGEFDDIAELNLCAGTAVLRESLTTVPVAHWWAAIQRAEIAQAAQSVPARPEERKLNDAAPSRKERDGRTKEGRAARLAAQIDSA